MQCSSCLSCWVFLSHFDMWRFFQILRGWGVPPSQNPTSFIRRSSPSLKLQPWQVWQVAITEALTFWAVFVKFWSTRSMNYLNSAQIGDPSISKSGGIPCVEGLDVRLGCKCLMNPVWVHQGSLINQDNSGEWRQDLHAKWWYYPDPLRSPEVSEVRCTRTCFAFHSPTVVFWNLRFHLALNKSVGHLWKLAAWPPLIRSHLRSWNLFCSDSNSVISGHARIALLHFLSQS